MVNTNTLLEKEKAMPNKYYIKMSVDFAGEIVAESQEEAEKLAWDKWGENSDAEISYDGVRSIKAEDMGEICEECDQVEDECDCNKCESCGRDCDCNKEEEGEVA